MEKDKRRKRWERRKGGSIRHWDIESFPQHQTIPRAGDPRSEPKVVVPLDVD